MDKVEGHFATLTPEQFIEWMYLRVTAGNTLDAIGNEFGVNRATISRWLSGHRKPPRMALILAAQLANKPQDLASGLN